MSSRKSAAGALAVACVFAQTIPVFACKAGQLVKIEGAVLRIFANQSGSWTMAIGNLKDKSFGGCNFVIGTYGEKTSAPWIQVPVKTKPASCNVGARATATIKVVDGLMGADFDTESVNCN